MTRIHYQIKAFGDLAPEELYAVMQLRLEVFIVEQDCPYQDADGLDPVALHLLGQDAEGRLESYARILPVGASYAEHAAIGRVITSPRVRGTGEGRRLMEAARQGAEEAYGADVPLRLGAQDYALDFYRRLGFEVAGEGYLEDGIPHTPMELRRGSESPPARPPRPGTGGAGDGLAPLHPRVRLLWRITAGIRAVVWTAGAGALEHWGQGRTLVDALHEGWFPPGTLTAGVAGFWVLLLLVLPGLRYRRWRYALRDADLWIRRGILVHRVSVIPYRQLQFVDTRQGPLERWLGLTELVVHTAAPGTSGLIPGLQAQEAESLREVLARQTPGGGPGGAPGQDAPDPDSSLKPEGDHGP